MPTQVLESGHQVAERFAGARAGFQRISPSPIERLSHETSVFLLLFAGLQFVAFGLGLLA